MKRIVIVILILIFAGAVVSRNAFAAETSGSKSVTYKLPYPGTLPDSPLYGVKNLRDQILGLLVMGPVNRGFYFLLLSDKRVWAGQMLVDGGNSSLGAATFLASEEYFSLAVDEASEAKKQRLDVSDLSAKLLVAATKHEEILSAVSPNVAHADLPTFNKAVALAQKSRSQVVALTNGN